MSKLSLLSLLILIPAIIACGKHEDKEKAESDHQLPQPSAPASDRYCLALDLKPDAELIRQYKYVHSPEGMWPEIPKGIREAGCLDMEIYLLGTRMFLIVEIPKGADLDEIWEKMGKLDRQDEWSEYVWQFQQALPEAKEGEKWILMEKVYDLDDY